MKTRLLLSSIVCVVALGLTTIVSADWPQWRGPNRDAKVTGFKAPKTWPKELTKKWSVNVGQGVSTPALVAGKLYVCGRENGNEITRCLDAATGKKIWENKYAAQDATGAAARFPVKGPRSSPTVAEGKVITLGTRGTLSCLDAATGKKLWRKDDIQGWPRFYVSSSPIIAEGMCIAQLGGRGNGAIVAYDLATGNEKWKWTGDSPAYASPVLMTVDSTKAIVAPMARNMVAINLANGKLLWEIAYKQGRYNAATPIADGETLIYAGPNRGMTAVKIAKKGAKLDATELWHNNDNSVKYNTPVLRNGLIFGLSTGDSLFCINAKNGKTAWTKQVDGRRGYGSIIDCGSVLLALTPSAELIVFQPTAKGFQRIASYPVAEGNTYAYPIVAGNRIYVRDRDTLTLWTIE